MMERSKCMNIPKVRFHGFKEKWREESLSKLFVERHEISTITESLPQLSFTISEGVIYPDDRKSNKRDFLIKDILSKKYLVTCVGDILYNPANVIYGAIHRNSLCDGVVSPIYKIFKTEQDSNFMECVVRNPSFISQLSMKTEGTVTKLKTLKPESFLEMIVKIAPSIYEQRKIASYFQTLDSLIQTTSKKLASLRQIKEASLQAMFPQEGETTPKVRFKGFEGEWEKEKLGKLFRERIENNINGELLSVTINNGIIKASDNGRFDNSNNDKSHYKAVKIEDIVYNTMRMWQGASGYSAYEGIVSPAYTVIIPQEQVFPLFFAYLFKTQSLINIFRIHSQGLTTDTWNLKFARFSIIEVCFPKSKLEQQKIASYFCNLDKQISLLTQRLEKLKQIKAACLDKMFV